MVLPKSTMLSHTVSMNTGAYDQTSTQKWKTLLAPFCWMRIVVYQSQMVLSALNPPQVRKIYISHPKPASELWQLKGQLLVEELSAFSWSESGSEERSTAFIRRLTLRWKSLIFFILMGNEVHLSLTHPSPKQIRQLFMPIDDKDNSLPLVHCLNTGDFCMAKKQLLTNQLH